MISRLGPGWDNISGDWGLAVRLAEIGNNRGDTGVTPKFPSFGTTYPAPIASVDDAYFNAAGLRDDVLGALDVGGGKLAQPRPPDRHVAKPAAQDVLDHREPLDQIVFLEHHAHAAAR